MTYADSSILVPVYSFEDTAEDAQKLLSGLSHPVLLNHFLWLEIRNASCRSFLTFDNGQAKLAKAAGLKIIDHAGSQLA
jgi:hypothetical protein